MRIDPFADASRLMVMPQAAGSFRTVDFKELIKGSVGEVNRMQGKAEQLIEGVSADEGIDPEVVANAVLKADIAFRTMIQIRNKLTDAFQELRNMQL